MNKGLVICHRCIDGSLVEAKEIWYFVSKHNDHGYSGSLQYVLDLAESHSIKRPPLRKWKKALLDQGRLETRSFRIYSDHV